MKLIILIAFTAGLAHSFSVVPERVITPSLDLFSSKNKILPSGDVEVRVTTFSKKGDFIKNGSTLTLAKEKFDGFLLPSKAVFKMVPDQNQSGDISYTGTAFSIGNNLVLTNNHVLDPSFKNTTECGPFQLKDHEGNTFDCRTVHFCDPQNDVCLIEMSPLTKTKKDCFFCSGTKYQVNLGEGLALKLKSTYAPVVFDDEILTAIGNSAGLGIHLSQGRGTRLRRDKLIFYAPITGGNSGGPLLNDQGLVVGVVKQESQSKISFDFNEAYNVAAPMELMIKKIRDSLRNDPTTLLKFNQSVVE